MHPERDALVSTVFPELRERCRARQVNLVEVDLRWGVSRADAEDGRVLDICREEIDACRPFYLGLIGHRYGSIPQGHSQSLTEAEVMHALIQGAAPVRLYRAQLNSVGLWPLSGEAARILGAAYHTDLSGSFSLNPNAGSRAHADAVGLLEPLARASRKGALFLARDREQGSEEEQDARMRQLRERLHHDGLDIREYRSMEAFIGEALGGLWRRLDSAFPLEARRDVPPEAGWVEAAARPHAELLGELGVGVVDRPAPRQRIEAFCRAPGPARTLLVTGAVGCGKSTLLGEAIRAHGTDTDGELVLYHLVGAGPRTTRTEDLLYHLVGQLHQAQGTEEQQPPGNREVQDTFSFLLKEAAARRPVLLVIDGLDQMEAGEGGCSLGWLPWPLPAGVRLLASSRPGPWSELLERQHPAPEVLRVGELEAEQAGALVDAFLARQGKAFPEPDDRGHLLSLPAARSPLYLKVALEELRRFGRFEQLGARVRALPPSLEGLLAQVLERLEQQFAKVGPGLVREALVLLHASREGLTAEELQELLPGRPTHGLQLDPVTRLPDLIWARLRRAFGTLLSERSGVFGFFHQGLREAVQRRYLLDGHEAEAHKRLARFFEARWSRPDPRALDELLHQMTLAGDWERLATSCLGALDYLHLRLRHMGHTSPPRILGDLCALLDQPDVPAKLRRIAEMHLALFRSNMATLCRTGSGFFPGHQLIQLCASQGHFPELRQRAAAWIDAAQLDTPLLTMLEPLQVDRSLPDALVLKVSKWIVTGLRVDSAGRRMAVAQGDGQVSIWDCRTGYRLQTLANEEDYDVKSMAFLPGERLLATGRRPCLWDLVSGRRWRVPGTDGRFRMETLLALDDGRLITREGSELALVDAASGEVLHRTEVNSRYVINVCRQVSGDRFLVVNHQHAFVWQPGATREVAWEAQLGRHGADCGAITDDGLVVTANHKGSAVVRDLETGELRQRLVGPSGGGYACAEALVGGLVVLGTEGGCLGVWEAGSGKLRAWCQAFTKERITAMALGGDDALYIGGTGGEVHEYPVSSLLARRLAFQDKDQGNTNGIALLPTAPDTLVAGGGRTVLDQKKLPVYPVFMVKAGEQGGGQFFGDHAAPVAGVVATPDGRRIISAGEEGRVVFWRRIKEGNKGGGGWRIRKERELKCKGRVMEFCISPCGSRVAAHTMEKMLYCWEVSSGELVNAIGQGEEQSISLCFVGWDRLATGNLEGFASVWDVGSGRVVQKCVGEDKRRLYSLAAGAGGWIYGGTDEDIFVWDADTGAVIKRIPLGLDNGASALCLARRGGLLASGHWDATVRIWDTGTMRCLAAARVAADVHCLDFIGRRVVVGSWGHRQYVALDLRGPLEG